jgi:hypothetical protein
MIVNTPKEAIFLARKYGLEEEIRMELAAGLTPQEAIDEWVK